MGDVEVMKRFVEEHKVAVLIGVLLFCVILYLGEYMLFLTNKEDYSKMTGVIVDRYYDGYDKYTTHRKKNRQTVYMDVQYTYNGEQRIAEKLKSNFGEKEGNTVHFYVTPEGAAVRGTPIIRIFDFNYILLICAYLVWILWKKRGETPKKSATPVGIVVDDDLIL